LEKHLNSFKDCNLQDLITHGIKALAGTLPNETKLNNKNLSICLVGKDTKFKCLSEAETEEYITADVLASGRGGTTSEARRGTDDDQPPPNPQDPIPDVATME
jgi:20S proteasome subunit alpha 6